jgi:hypothetical protein
MVVYRMARRSQFACTRSQACTAPALLGPLLHHLTPAHASYVAGREFFPHLITAPFHSGLGVAFGFAIAATSSPPSPRH